MTRSISTPRRIHATAGRWLGLLVAVLASAVFVDAPWAQGTPPVSVAIRQLEWLDEDGQVAASNSTTGIAEFTFEPSASSLAVGEGGAYVNLYTSLDAGITYQLAVENLYVRFANEAERADSRLTALIDLGNEDDIAVSSLSYQVALTADPIEPPTSGTTGGMMGMIPDFGLLTHQGAIVATLPDPEATLFEFTAQTPDDVPADFVVPQPAPVFTQKPLASAPVFVSTVARSGYSFGGYGGTGLLAPQGRPGRPHPWRPVLRPAAPPLLPPPPVPPGRPQVLGSVQGAIPVINESPMSCAPSAIARSIRYMRNLRGQGGPSAQAMMNALYGLMGTTAQGGTSGANMLNGKAAYSAANNLGINTVFPASVGQAAAALNVGGDVELNILWPGTNGCRAGGHVAMVTSIVLLPNGNFQVTYVDDERQGDGVAANNYHVLIVRPNGAIVSGFPCPGGVIAGLLAETMP